MPLYFSDEDAGNVFINCPRPWRMDCFYQLILALEWRRVIQGDAQVLAGVIHQIRVFKSITRNVRTNKNENVIEFRRSSRYSADSCRLGMESLAGILRR